MTNFPPTDSSPNPPKSFEWLMAASTDDTAKSFLKIHAQALSSVLTGLGSEILAEPSPATISQDAQLIKARLPEVIDYLSRALAIVNLASPSLLNKLFNFAILSALPPTISSEAKAQSLSFAAACASQLGKQSLVRYVQQFDPAMLSSADRQRLTTTLSHKLIATKPADWGAMQDLLSDLQLQRRKKPELPEL